MRTMPQGPDSQVPTLGTIAPSGLYVQAFFLCK